MVSGILRLYGSCQDIFRGFLITSALFVAVTEEAV
jgi:hypothetical protein